MKTLHLTLLLTLFSAVPVALTAPGNGKGKKKNAAAPAAAPAVPAAPATPAVKPAAPAPVRNFDLNAPTHVWGDGDGHQIEAAFKGLENGLLSLQAADGRALRLVLTRLSPEDQKYAKDLKARQPRPSLAPEVVAKAAGNLDQTILTVLKKADQQPNEAATDEEFVRRIYLDVIGRIPTRLEAQEFLGSTAPDKRAKLIDQLLDQPGYTMHMFNWFADMLRVKDDYGKGAKSFLYEDWLKDQVALNRPWDAMVKEMLTADGRLSENGAAGYLLRDAQMPLDGVSNLLTTFLGANVSCAQCHDHPLAQWTQKDFYQLASFFGASDGYQEGLFRQIRQMAKKDDVAGLNKGQLQAMLMPNVYNMVDLPKNHLEFPKDYKYTNAKPGQKVEPALVTWASQDKSSAAYKIDTEHPEKLRDEFARWMTHSENPRFATAIANRLWKKVFGMAVQEPVTDLDDPKEACSPELLAQITTYMKQAKFDLREFQRILFNTAAYQRKASRAPHDDKQKFLFTGPLLRRMTAEQAWDSIVLLASGPEVDQTLLRRGDDMKYYNLPGNTVNVPVVKDLVEKMKENGVVPRAGGGGKKKGGQKFSPAAIATAYEGHKPELRGGLVLARASELPQPAPETHFLRLFGQSDRLVADTNASDGSVTQVLSLMNGPAQEVVSASSDVLGDAQKSADVEGKVKSLYLSFLGRAPSADESAKSVAALNGGLSVRDLAWVLLNTREFLFVR